jgi:hypothetical protein
VDAVIRGTDSPPVAAARRACRSLRARIVRAAICACAAGLAALPALAAETGTALERSVKAAYLYKFLGYVDWPATALPPPGAPLVIGVSGADDILAELQKITPDRTIADRPLEARRVKDADTLPGIHVLFVGRGDTPRLPELVRLAQQHSILVVSEVEGGLRSGSVINLVISEGRVRFEVSLDAAEKSGLKLSSRLLALAQTVRPGAR